MLVVRRDGPLPIDRLDLRVTSKGSTLRDRSYRVPEEADLPTTLAIASNGDNTASVELAITGWSGSLPLDRRSAIVTQIPVDRLAMLEVVLSGRCSAKVRLEDGEAISTCGEGSTCDPRTGGCTSSQIDARTLPSYQPGAELIGSAGAESDGSGEAGSTAGPGEGGSSGQPGSISIGGAGPPGGGDTGGIPSVGGDALGGAAGAAGVVGCNGSPCADLAVVIDEWQGSAHFATSNLDGGELPSWKGATPCGNCHGRDSIEQRLAGNVMFSGTAGPGAVAQGQLSYLSTTNGKVAESTYKGSSPSPGTNCKTCHVITPGDNSATGGPYVFGSSPLRVPSGVDDEALLEKSSSRGASTGTPAGKFQAGNVCVWCHKSRADVTNYISATQNSLTNIYWGPHSGPEADVYSGQGGYHYSGKSYRNSSHGNLSNGCVACHMPAEASNQGAANHSFGVTISACTTAGCHGSATNFNVLGAQTMVTANLQELRGELNARGWLTRQQSGPFNPLTQVELAGTDFEHDFPMPGVSGLTADQAGALYNYLLLARGAALGVHNPIYTRQLFFDSFQSLTSSAPTTQSVRP